MALGWDWSIEVTGLPTIDRAEVERAARLLFSPGERYAIQALPSGGWDVVDGGDVPGILGAVQRRSGESGCYYSLNPLIPGYRKPDRGGWRNTDVARRRWILADVDAGQPKNGNATNGEKAAAVAVAFRVREHLIGLGWPPPVEIDTGNGWHMLWAVDLPNDKLTQQAVAKLLKTLAASFDVPGGAHVDTGVHDSKRVARFPGTMNRKGPHSEERPQRMCRLVSAPAERRVVSYDMIAAAAGIGAEPGGGETPQAPPPARVEAPPARQAMHVDGPGEWTVPPPGDLMRRRVEGKARNAVEGKLSDLAATPKNRQRMLYDKALEIGSYVPHFVSYEEAASRLRGVAEAIGLGQDGDPDEIRRGIENGLTNGMVNPKTYEAIESAIIAEDAAMGVASPAAPPAGQPSPVIATAGAAIVVPKRLSLPATEFKPRELHWIWRNWIPRGKLVTIAGAGGLGKSFVMCDLAARISAGKEIPCGNGECFDVGSVLIVNCEDDAEDTIVPRLIEAGANRERIHICTSEAIDSWTLARVDLLEEEINAIGGVSLVIIDPATAFVGGVDDHKNSQLQTLLKPLRTVAMRTGATIALVTHVNKDSPGKTDAAQRVIGGVAWVNAARAGIIFTRDREDRSKRLILPFKSNNGVEVDGLRYSIQSTETLARVAWEGPAGVDVDEAMSHRPAKPGKVTDDEIEAAIRNLFKATLVIPSSVGHNAVRDGLGVRDKNKISAIRQKMKIKAVQAADGWEWRAPPEFLTG